MTSIQQRAELQRRIWQIANNVRGAVDGWDFKQYVLGTLFYRFISENFAAYIEGGDDSIQYAMLNDIVITPEIKDDAIKTKGYFIYPSQLFANVAASANTNDSLNTDLAKVFSAIETSTMVYPSERDIRGLFADFDTTSNRLGNSVRDKNDRLTDQPDYAKVRNYWKWLKNKLKVEGSEVVSDTNKLKLEAPDGKQRLTDVLDTQQVFRIIQSIPSRKAEPFKLWLAEVASQRLDQLQDPELSIEQAMLDYKRLSMKKSATIKLFLPPLRGFCYWGHHGHRNPTPSMTTRFEHQLTPPFTVARFVRI